MKATIKILFASVLTLTMISTVIGQQQAQFTQYVDNMVYYNPAYAGSHEGMSISALHRQQWAGFDGAPMSTTFGLHTPLIKNLGLGVSMLNDKVGPINSTWANVSVSYTVNFENRGKLAFGINGGFNLLNGNLLNLHQMNAGDQSLNVQYSNDFKPNFGAGVYYHSEKWFAGFAVPHILDNAKDIGDILNEDFMAQRHYYLMFGGYIPANEILKLRPSAMLKITENAPFALDMSLAFILYDKLWLGANYRLIESAGIFAQYQISNQFKIGYAFEYSTTKLRSHNAGTHELMISYDIMLKGQGTHGSAPRFF